MHALGFDVAKFLTTCGVGRRVLHLKPRQAFFSQGEAAASVYYLNKGRAKLTVVSHAGKEATITLLGEGDFAGEEALTIVAGRRLATATALTACTAVQIDTMAFARMVRAEKAFADYFLTFILARNMRTQADLVDQLFNSSEKRLARILLLMANFGNTAESETLIPRISQETLAEMVGTTRSRVSFFMNRFRHHGFIEYRTRIKVHRSLLTLVLENQPFEGSAFSPEVLQAVDLRAGAPWSHSPSPSAESRDIQ